jgi:hypothetical protein
MGAIPAGGQPHAGVACPAGGPTGVRVYLQSPVRRGYLATVMAPLARRLVGQFGAERVHVVTGWRFGPHFDLKGYASPGRPVDWDEVGQALAEGARRCPPPPGGADEEDYLRTATLLGQIEAVPPPYLPLRAHGHTELLEPGAADRLAELKATGLAHLLAPLTEAATTDAEGALLARVAEAFVALADAHPYGLRFGSFSLRSHAEAFLHWAAPAADYRRAFDNRMGKDRAVLEELVRRTRDGAQSPSAAAWARAFHACLADFEGQVSDADLDQATPGAGVPVTDLTSRPRPPRRTGPTAPLTNATQPRPVEGPSAFHAAVAASGVTEDPPVWFAGFRLTINLFYQLLPALDVSPVRRFYLCHAIAESVDAVFGETWQSRLNAVGAHMAAAP